MTTFVDISVPLMSGIASDPPGGTPEIEYITHQDSVADMLFCKVINCSPILV